ncbi:MAG TPA: ABC transporter permease [Cyclobacteriaceae bacterium]
MTLSFIHSFQSEWMKKKRSLASWLVIIGGFFTPAIVVVVRLVHYDSLPTIYANPIFWQSHWRTSWESVAIFLLPIGVIMATSLITQIEYKNNAWKQVHTAPLSLPTIFFSKLSVIVVMMLQFFVLFNIGIYLSAVIPYLVISGVPYPADAIPFLSFLKQNGLYFVDCLPIIALQYLLSLKYKNFLVPMGAGFLLWIMALGSLVWKYGYTIPYSYVIYNYLADEPVSKAAKPELDIHLLAIGYFVGITIISYILYVTKKEKG